MIKMIERRYFRAAQSKKKQDDPRIFKWALEGISYTGKNRNGRIYDPDMLWEALRAAQTRSSGIVIHANDHSRSACAIVRRIERNAQNGMIFIYWQWLDTSLATSLKFLMSEGCPYAIVPVGEGDVEADGRVTNYILHSLMFVDDPA